MASDLQTLSARHAPEEACRLNQRLEGLDTAAMLRVAAGIFPGSMALISSFGTQSAVLLHLVAEADPTLPVIFHPDAGRALLRALFSVLAGGAIYRRSSYLVGREGTEVASPRVAGRESRVASRESEKSKRGNS